MVLSLPTRHPTTNADQNATKSIGKENDSAPVTFVLKSMRPGAFPWLSEIGGAPEGNSISTSKRFCRADRKAGSERDVTFSDAGSTFATSSVTSFASSVVRTKIESLAIRPSCALKFPR